MTIDPDIDPIDIIREVRKTTERSREEVDALIRFVLDDDTEQ